MLCVVDARCTTRGLAPRSEQRSSAVKWCVAEWSEDARTLFVDLPHSYPSTYPCHIFLSRIPRSHPLQEILCVFTYKALIFETILNYDNFGL